MGLIVNQVVPIGHVELFAVTLELAKVASAESVIVVMFLVDGFSTFHRWGVRV